jgi:hypothetical protein
MHPVSSSRHEADRFWSCLEALPGLIALPRVWRARLGAKFEAARALMLQEKATPAELLPCPRGCGLAHEIVSRPDGSLAAICGGDPSRPYEIPLTAADVMPLEVSWSRLGRALWQGLAMNGRLGALPPPNTIQFGAWSAEAVPAILTIQVCPTAFRRVVAELATRVNGPFLLFAPTSHHVDAPCLEMLARVRAGFFPLETTVLVDADGRLRPVRPPGVLFARFTPQPKELDQDAAGGAMAIINTLDTGTPPTPLTVFRLYCGEGHSIPEIARKLGVGTTTIARRLEVIRTRTGCDPKDLRRSAAGPPGSEEES